MDKPRAKRIPEQRQVFGVEVAEHAPIQVTTSGASVIRPRLNQWYATAICGNDITSSCLYVAAICTRFAGRLAPLALLAVVGLLYLYRKIYGEVVGALPLNGGAYNALLNSTTKFKASMAACMTILSYMATAVISAKTAVAYFSSLVSVPVIPVTIAVLAAFMGLTIIGLTESARAALAIFVFHIAALVTLCVTSVIFAVSHPEVFSANWEAPLPNGEGVFVALFFGFASGLLGISGFESSANFVEEQATGVFPKTLRNMWIAVSIFNPLIAFLALAVLPIAEVASEANQDYLLATMGHVSGGGWLHTTIAVDASLVLCGAVLTSFVGVGGLVHRMALDRCLPQLLLKRNRRGSHHRIALLFFILCASIILVTGGDLFALAGVYTISFLGVMSLFVVGNILLKLRRSKLPRPERAGWLTVIVALALTITGLIGNVLIDSRYLGFFLTYFVPTVLVVGVMLLRTHLLKLFLTILKKLAERVGAIHEHITHEVLRRIEEINSQRVIFFTRGDSLTNLNNAMLYVRKNELTKRVTVVLLYRKRDEIPDRLEGDLKFLDEVYTEIKIELVVRQGDFNPQTIEHLSEEYGVPKNYMFIGAPGDGFAHNLADLGGVRIII
ncbi:APC family permease [Myxococcota bacterium]